MTEDCDLLLRFADSRAEDAFAELVRRHIDLVYSVALRQVGGDVQLAQDVAQALFTALARKAASLLEHPTLSGWLYRTTQFTATDLVRKERRRRRREQESHEMQETVQLPGSPPDWDALRPLLDQAITGLKTPDREAVCMRYFDDRSYAEIGARISVSENAARMRVERALNKLHAALSRRGVTSTTAALAVALSGQIAASAPAGLALSIARSAVSATGSAAAGATAAWSISTLMNTQTAIAAVAGAVALAAVGAAIHQARQTSAHRAELAAAAETVTGLHGQIDHLQSELTRHGSLVRSAEELVRHLRTEIQSLRQSADQPPQQRQEEITRTLVQSRYDRAKELDREGRLEEALSEYLWCYDTGMPAVRGMTGVRSSYLLSDIARLGERFPAALEALRARRDRAERLFLGNPGETSAALDLHPLNRALGEETRSLKLHDSLPGDDPRSATLKSLLFDQFLAAQRYEDAAQSHPYSRMSAEIERMLHQSAPADKTEQAQRVAKLRRSRLVHRAGACIEVLLGAGRIEQAADLGSRVLQLESDPEMIEALERHAARAGHPGWIASLKGL